MSFRSVQSLARVVGRRAALRYLAIGFGATVLSACAGRDAGGGAASTDARHGQPTPTPAATGSRLAKNAFAAFVRGSWHVRTTMTSDQEINGTAKIGDGTWTIDWKGYETWSGAWDLRDGRLALTVPESPNNIDQLAPAATTGVPSTVGDSASLFLPWQPPGASGTASGQQLEILYARGTLRIRHMENGSMTTHVCRRT